MLLFSCLSSLFSLSDILCSFSLFCAPSLLTLSFQFSFSLSWVPLPFVSFTFINHWYQSLPFVSSLFFLPLFLSATKDDASDKTDGKIISLCFTSYCLLIFFFFFLFFSLTSFQSTIPFQLL